MNKAGINLIVNAIIKEKFLVFILIISNGFNNFSIAVIRFVIVVVKVSTDAIDMSRTNFHIARIPFANSFLEKRMYINSMKRKIKKKGLRLLNKTDNFNSDKIVNSRMNIENIIILG